MRNQNIIVKNLTLAETIAHRNPEVANQLLIKNGYPASSNQAELARRLNSFLLNQRENALKQLANIHPDKELIFSSVDGFDNADGFDNIDGFDNAHGRGHYNKGKHLGNRHAHRHHNAEGEYSNCCGHSNADGEFSNCSGCGGSCAAKHMYFNAAGDSAAKSQAAAMPSLVNREMLAIVGVIALASIALIAISKKA